MKKFFSILFSIFMVLTLFLVSQYDNAHNNKIDYVLTKPMQFYKKTNNAQKPISENELLQMLDFTRTTNPHDQSE